MLSRYWLGDWRIMVRVSVVFFNERYDVYQPVDVIDNAKSDFQILVLSQILFEDFFGLIDGQLVSA